MYKLHKYSSPGWSKSFNTLGGLTLEVRFNTCRLCRESYGTDLESMLASDCGAEYSVEGLDLDERPRRFGQLQQDRDGQV